MAVTIRKHADVYPLRPSITCADLLRFCQSAYRRVDPFAHSRLWPAKIPICTHLAGILALAALTGCSQKLPSCLEAASAKSVKASIPAKPRSSAVPTRALFIGIDGSGSMVGHTRAANPSAWLSLLKAINLSTETLGLQSTPYRIGGGLATKLPTRSVTIASNPCFFEGCAPFQPPVASSLQTLWGIPFPGSQPPLRLLISDLEVNQNDISSLIAGIKSDLARGASVGVLALKLPFTGKVFESQGIPFFEGSLNRPVYLLATGSLTQVRELLDEIRKNMAQMGVQSQELSILDDSQSGQPLKAVDAGVLPPNLGYVGVPLQLRSGNYSPGLNSDYRFIQLKPGATGFSVSTIKPWSGGTTRPDLGLVRLERIPLATDESTSPGGVKIRKMLVAGSHLRLEFDVPSTTPAGVLRATINVLPEQWWIDWDRPYSLETKPAQKAATTQGLLLLLTTLGSEIREARGAPPAATLCMVFQPST